ncbi:unnamed protein product [Rotaria magnacalcarata]
MRNVCKVILIVYGLILLLFYTALFITKCVIHSKIGDHTCFTGASLYLVLSAIANILWPAFVGAGQLTEGRFSKVTVPTIETTTTTYSSGRQDVTKRKGTKIVHFGKN